MHAPRVEKPRQQFPGISTAAAASPESRTCSAGEPSDCPPAAPASSSVHVCYGMNTSDEQAPDPNRRVAIWNHKEQRKLAGTAAPFERNISKYLEQHKDCAVYKKKSKSVSEERVLRLLESNRRRKARENRKTIGTVTAVAHQIVARAKENKAHVDAKAASAAAVASPPFPSILLQPTSQMANQTSQPPNCRCRECCQSRAPHAPLHASLCRVEDLSAAFVVQHPMNAALAAIEMPSSAVDDGANDLYCATELPPADLVNLSEVINHISDP